MIFVTYSAGSGILNNLGGVHALKEDSIKLVDKVTIVDMA